MQVAVQSDDTTMDGAAQKLDGITDGELDVDGDQKSLDQSRDPTTLEVDIDPSIEDDFEDP